MWHNVVRRKYGEEEGGWRTCEIGGGGGGVRLFGVRLWNGDGLGSWAPCFARAFNDWELEEVERFLSRLQRKRVHDLEDRVVWVGAKDGNFVVKRLYGELDLRREIVFPSKVIWNAWAPPEAKIFAWEATWNKILTLDNIKKRGWEVANRCYFCKKEEESTDHLLFHCDLTRDLMELCFFLVWCVLGAPFHDEGGAS